MTLTFLLLHCHVLSLLAGAGMTYELTETNLTPFYVDVALNHPELRVLVYNGDTDPGINRYDTQHLCTKNSFE